MATDVLPLVLHPPYASRSRPLPPINPVVARSMLLLAFAADVRLLFSTVTADQPLFLTAKFFQSVDTAVQLPFPTTTIDKPLYSPVICLFSNDTAIFFYSYCSNQPLFLPTIYFCSRLPFSSHSRFCRSTLVFVQIRFY